MTIKQLFIFITIILLPFCISGQEDIKPTKKKWYPQLGVNYQNGSIIPTTDFVKGDNSTGLPLTSYSSLSIKIGFQNPGYTDWQKVYHGPYYGLGYHIADFNNTLEMGNPMSLFGYFGIPIIRAKKLELYTELQFGAAWNWTHYDSISNPHNLAIGSSVTVYLNVGLNAFYPITKKLDLGAGISLSHYSNGGFERPNRGVNIWAPSVELKYHFAGRSDVRNIEKAPKLPCHNDLYFMLGYGDHQLNEHELDTNYYAIGGLGIYYSIQHNNYFRSGPGIDLNYMFSLTANPDGTPGKQGTLDNITVGLVYAPELIIDRFSIITGFGIYAKHKQYGNFNQLYQRAGVKYHFTENFSAGMNVRAINFMLAEFLEFNVGYRIKWSK